MVFGISKNQLPKEKFNDLVRDIENSMGIGYERNGHFRGKLCSFSVADI